jgi:hypothetical protein
MFTKIAPLILLIGLAAPAGAAPIIDGFFDPNEGYTTEIPILLNLDDGPTGIPGGRLYQAIDAASISVALIFPRFLVDNSYGANSIGWGDDAPSGKDHSLKSLKGSDKALFHFTDAAGNSVLEFLFDYIDEDNDQYFSGGVADGDGKMELGDESDVLAFGTSLDYNFNVLGLDTFLKDSPPADHPDWVFDVIYEVQVAASAFGDAGFGSVAIPEVHASPNKLGKNVVTVVTSGPPIVLTPEPSVALMLGGGLVAMGLGRRRSRRGATR